MSVLVIIELKAKSGSADELRALLNPAQIRASAGNFPPLRWLHGLQAETRLSQECNPPRERGTTWSIVKS